MPKPGKFNNKPNWKKQYNEHDNRNNTEHPRRVTFKPNRYGKKGPNKDWGASLQAHFEEEDIDMGGFSSRKNFYGGNQRRGGGGGGGSGRSGSPAPHKLQMKRKLLEGPISWYRITLPFGNKYDKQFIMKTLLDNVQPQTFSPLSWSVNGTVATFYIDDFKVADKLNSLDREIHMPDGFRMLIRVRCGSPNVDITTTMKEKMKTTMAKRYNAATKALDLTRFHADPDLQDLFCALFKPIILLAVIDIIAENIPELEALNLAENKIQMLNHLRRINKKLPELKILHMGNNKIRDITMLDSLMGLPIVDLLLDGNPLCDKFKDQEMYISEVRKRFPKVVKLDGIDLPPPISFDITAETSFPISQQTFLCNGDGQGIVRQFLEQYFLIYDGDSRQPLLQAYHEHAMFSMTSCYPYGQHNKNSSWLNWYNTDNRNLMHVKDSDRRHKLLRYGQLSIVTFIAEMPTSKHDIHSFTVDLNLFTPQMLILTVSGVFRELRTGHKVAPIRYFFRTLVIVPAGSGFCIANEELHITNATDAQAKVAFKTPVPVPVPTLPEVSSPVSVAGPSNAAPDDNVKQQMIQAMAQQSGMNLEWSQKCLEETQWDFQKAGFVFAELQKQGIIPPEAFAK